MSADHHSTNSNATDRTTAISRRQFVASGAAGLLLWQSTVRAVAEVKKSVTQSADEVLFGQGMIPELHIVIDPQELEKLKADNRSYVKCHIEENSGRTYQNVGIKLKGAAGSFRDFDDRPALTLNVTKFDKGTLFHGLTKFHLNNSVQDETYLNEWLCEILFRAAEIPATRVTHARVWLNDRDVGLYVLKEGFDRTFLRRHFKNPDGNLYDGGFLQDIDVDLEKDCGKGPDDHSDLKALLAACREEDLAKRWKLIDEQLDVDKFITFMAMETMTGHWDGYTLSRNNYRLYFDPKSQKAHFLPHGMDQMFGDPNASILDFPEPIVASAVMRNSEWRAKYRERINQLLPLFAPPVRLLEQVDIGLNRLQPILAAIDPDLARNHLDRVNELKERLIARAENLIQQSQDADPKPLEFDENGQLALNDWHPESECEDAVIELVDLPEEKKAYSILCGPSEQCIASWRCKILLANGRYRFEAKLRLNDVEPLEDEKGTGAGIRISGLSRSNHAEGTAELQTVDFEFRVDEDVRDVIFVAELRAKRGQVWFDPESMRLTRLETKQAE